MPLSLSTFFEILRTVITAVHPLQNIIRTGLNRQMNVLAQGIHLGEAVHQVFRQILRM